MAGGLGGLGGFGSVLGALGQSLLTSPRENPFQGLPAALQAGARDREHQAALSAMSTVAEKLGVPRELAASPEAMKLFIDHINTTKLNQLRQQAAQGGTFTPPEDSPTSQPSMSVPGLQGSSGIPTTFNVAGGGGGLDGPGGLGGGGGVATPKLPTFAAIQGGTPSGKIAGVISQAAERYGIDPNALVRTAQIESSLNPNAKNPRSTAGGLFQFINSTAKQYGLTNKFDPAASADAGARLMRDNANHLRNVLGRDPQPWELYLAHQQGSGGAAKLLSNPNASAASLVGADSVRLNGGSPGMTAQQFAGIWRKKFGDLPSSSQNATGLLAAASGTAPDYARADAQRIAMGGTLGGRSTAGGVPLPPPRPTQLASADPNAVPLPSTAMQRVMDEAVTRGIGQGGPGIGQSGAPLNQVAAGRGRSLSVPIPAQTNIPAPSATPAPVTSPPVGTGDTRTKAAARAEFQRGMNILAASNGDPVLMKQAEIIMQSARKYLEPSEAARRVAEAGLQNTPVGRATIAGLPATAVEQLTEQLIPGYVSPSTLEQKKFRSAEEERAYQHSKGERQFESAEEQRRYQNQFGERKFANEIGQQTLDYNLRTKAAQLEGEKFDYQRYQTDRAYRQQVDQATFQRTIEQQRLGLENQRFGLEGQRFANTQDQQAIQNQQARDAMRQQRDIATESHGIALMTPEEKAGAALNAPGRAPNIRAGQEAKTAQAAAEAGARDLAAARTRFGAEATGGAQAAEGLLASVNKAEQHLDIVTKLGGYGPFNAIPGSRALNAIIPDIPGLKPGHTAEIERQQFDQAIAGLGAAKAAAVNKSQGGGNMSATEQVLARMDLPTLTSASPKVAKEAFQKLREDIGRAQALDRRFGIFGGEQQTQQGAPAPQSGQAAPERAPAAAPIRDGATAINPRTGKRIILMNGKWVDAGGAM